MKNIRSCLFLTLSLLLSGSFAHASSSLYDLSFANTEEVQVNLSTYKGKVVLLNFWATWCPPCIKEMPSMQGLKEAMADQPFEIIAVNVGENATSVSSFLLELEPELTFPILLDESGSSFGKLGLRGLPMSLIYDQQGNIVTRVLGGKEWDNPETVNELKGIITQ